MTSIPCTISSGRIASPSHGDWQVRPHRRVLAQLCDLLRATSSSEVRAS